MNMHPQSADPADIASSTAAPAQWRKASLPTKKLYLPVFGLLSVLIVTTIYWQDYKRASRQEDGERQEIEVQTTQSDRVVREEVQRQFDEVRQRAEDEQEQSIAPVTTAAATATAAAQPTPPLPAATAADAATVTAAATPHPATAAATPRHTHSADSSRLSPAYGWRHLSDDVREAAAASPMVVLNRAPQQAPAAPAPPPSPPYPQPSAASDYALLRDAINATGNPATATAAAAAQAPGRTDSDRLFLTQGPPPAPVSPVMPPREDGWVVHEGTVIPAVLLSAVDSTLPGPVIAQVAAPIYDSISGRTVVIPGGARLIGDYNAAVRHGQNRVQLVFRRLLYPDGSSVALNGSPGGAPDGSIGVRGKVRRGLLRALGSGLLVAWLTEEADENSRRNRGKQPTVGTVNGSVQYNNNSRSAEVVADVGTRAVAPYTQLRPRITIAPGTLISVVTSQDVLLRKI